MAQALNPVQRRLAELLQHWQAFVDLPDPRLLVWTHADNAKRLLEAFFELQRHDPLGRGGGGAAGGAGGAQAGGAGSGTAGAGTAQPDGDALGASGVSGDTFLVFDAPFEHGIAYARTLKQALAGHYAASHDELRGAGQTPDWAFDPAQTPDTAAAFAAALASLALHHPVFGHLVAVLSPASVSDDGAWAAWIARVLDAGLPAHVRLLVTDAADAPRVTGSVLASHPLARVQPLALEAWSVAQETFAQEAAVGPAGVFRSLLTGLFALAEKGSADDVLLKARDALAFAHRQGWPDQAVAVRLLTAGVMLKERRCDEAVNHYQHARSSAEAARAAGHPAGAQLVLQSWFGEGAARLAAGQWRPAVDCYHAAAELAASLPHPLLQIEALRMGTFCLASDGDAPAAIAFGQPALAVGQRMQPASRPMTTLPLHSFELLRLTDPARAGQIAALRHQLERDEAALRQQLEARAAALEASGEAAALAPLEQATAEASAALVRDAQARTDQIAASADRPFLALFEQARALFGAAWPIAMPGAILPAGVPAGAASEGAAA